MKCSLSELHDPHAVERGGNERLKGCGHILGVALDSLKELRLGHLSSACLACHHFSQQAILPPFQHALRRRTRRGQDTGLSSGSISSYR